MKTDIGLSLPPAVNAFFERARNLILSPDDEWRRIARETATVRTLFLTHVAPLAAVFAIAPAIGGMLFPDVFKGVRTTPGALQLIVDAVLLFVLVCVGLYGMARFTDWIAPRFGGKRDLDAALKLSAYSSTAMLASGIFGLIPALGLLVLTGLWSVVTFYKGVTPLMQSDDDKAIPFTAAVVGLAVVATVIVSTISSGARQAASIQSAPAPASMAGAPSKPEGPILIQPETLAGYMPEALIGGWIREQYNQGNGGVMGLVGPTIEGVFVKDQQRITLRIVDLGPNPRVADVVATLKQSAKGDTASGYDRVRETTGRLVVERLDRTKGTVERLTIIDNRLVVQGEGVGVGEADLDRALAMIGENRLSLLARQGG